MTKQNCQTWKQFYQKIHNDDFCLIQILLLTWQGLQMAANVIVFSRCFDSNELCRQPFAYVLKQFTDKPLHNYVLNSLRTNLYIIMYKTVYGQTFT